ncbi:hypothetical protein KGP39_05575 [Weissella hellenica]|nr:hypothetical protein [Weissella hellenica]QDJ58097.1 hypothetical protein EFA59_00530 [Weissella hellenica]
MDLWGKITRIQGHEVTVSVSDLDEIERLVNLLKRNQLTDQPQAIIEVKDERKASRIQVKKAYAIMNDIADWTGYSPYEVKDLMKSFWVAETGEPYFSFGNTDMTTAREFISFLLNFAMQHHVPLRKPGLEVNDDLDTYMVMSLMHRSCVICGKHADIHHIDTVGMGNDRTQIDHRKHRLIALCREHHNLAHNLGWPTFSAVYHVKGMYLTGPQLQRLGLMSKKQMKEIDNDQTRTT